ncbi:hypothetical protein BC938DRAFT_479065 [Jimgerdemannia flammicorona]|uniref:Uncharacterized protein n=1 Tax=Jimgerdemannia flammicorona TaxID=994334 RepID=A0A433QLP2_9FUNG|nr:hypothetical protein BC938DRAFT_479065 [Jimgerdemannia flammicorona]
MPAEEAFCRLEYVGQVSPTTFENTIRKLVFRRIEKIITELWPNETAIVYGYFHLTDSDNNIVVHTKTVKPVLTFLLDLANKLREGGIAHHQGRGGTCADYKSRRKRNTILCRYLA